MGQVNLAGILVAAVCMAAIYPLMAALRRRQWSWLGLYVGTGCLLTALLHLMVPYAMLSFPEYAQMPAETGPIVWHYSLASAGLATMIVALFYAAALAAITPPKRWSAIAICLACVWMIGISSATVVNDYIIAGLPAGIAIGEELPAWIALPIIMVLITGPFICGIPWSLLRQYGRVHGESDEILRHYWLNLGIVLVVVVAVILGVSQVIWASDPRLARMGILLVVLLGLLMGGVAGTMILIRQNFLVPAIAIIDGVRNQQPLVDTAAIRPIWRGLAQSIEQNRRRAEEFQEQLEASRDALHRSEKLAALGQLLAGVSHELNNPLAAVIGQSSLLEEDLSGTPHAERVRKIQRAADRCSRIVQSFLAMARQKAPEFRLVSLNDQVVQAIELTEYQMRADGVTVDLQLDPALPPVEADSDQLHQVIVNLLTNARQAMESSPREPQITISTSHANGQVTLRITDNGSGISKAAKARIFDPFYTTKGLGEGTGIGLSYSLGVVEAHGGTLTLEPSRIGCRFAVSLPVASRDGEASEVAEHNSASAKGRVLVVDDEADVAETLADMLARLGLEPQIAIGGEAAQRVLAQGRPFALVISDIRMPDVDGPALHRWIAANRPDLANRTAFVTGDTMSANVAEFIARVDCPVLEKPYGRTALGKLVEEMLG